MINVEIPTSGKRYRKINQHPKMKKRCSYQHMHAVCEHAFLPKGNAVCVKCRWEP